MFSGPECEKPRLAGLLCALGGTGLNSRRHVDHVLAQFAFGGKRHVAIDQGKPVRMLPVRLKSGKTICLPNSVARIRDCPHPELADKFIRYLLSE